jgi:hypothetical protein
MFAGGTGDRLARGSDCGGQRPHTSTRESQLSLTQFPPEGSVACLAGRRIDEDDAESVRFPLRNELDVRASLSRVFVSENVRHLVCSAACGADIIALELCEAREIAATIVLPFAAQDFRRVSVIDRPGEWGPRFDRAIARAHESYTLIEMDMSPDDLNAFERSNEAIVSIAAEIPSKDYLAVIVWDSAKKNEKDITAHLRDLADARGFRLLEVSTLK